MPDLQKPSGDPCFWCSGMKWLGPVGAWFERTYWQCCKGHDLAYLQNTAQREQGRPHIRPRADIDDEFYTCMLNKGILFLPEIAHLSVRLLYWPSRLIKWAIGKSDVI